MTLKYCHVRNQLHFVTTAQAYAETTALAPVVSRRHGDRSRSIHSSYLRFCVASGELNLGKSWVCAELVFVGSRVHCPKAQDQNTIQILWLYWWWMESCSWGAYQLLLEVYHQQYHIASRSKSPQQFPALAKRAELSPPQRTNQKQLLAGHEVEIVTPWLVMHFHFTPRPLCFIFKNSCKHIWNAWKESMEKLDGKDMTSPLQSWLHLWFCALPCACVDLRDVAIVASHQVPIYAQKWPGPETMEVTVPCQRVVIRFTYMSRMSIYPRTLYI